MNDQGRQFKVKENIIGGGLVLRAGQVVAEGELRGYAETLRRARGLEEIRNRRQTGHRDRNGE